ncbi:virulence RhuM family protein [Desulfobacter postgatei]|mgnify:CR=1 FL=1|uniref:virulence RhuM family protein n=1 Tax=Desulfobacter postgatei TaxID=2293 RepID=UPI00259B32FE|nr:virulence RhuM family protein [uncultured Desulfobacter sp.]
MNQNEETRPQGELLVYQGQGLDSPVQVRLEGETVWLSQKLMAELYGVGVNTINYHISQIYEEEELAPQATIRKYRIVQMEGSRQVGRLIDHYNLEMIIAVGFRVRSRRGSQFRKWANERISEYLVKGFTMDDDRLKGQAGIVDYFDELLARIREIRASEARVYLMIKNIFALAGDYQEGEKQTQLFFATMQNKMHYAATGLTAAEIVSNRANAELPNMGLTSWKGARVLKADVGTAKNYLDKEEIDTLNRITVMFLDQAEFRAQRRQAIQMADWEQFLDKFLADVELPVLENAGGVKHQQAMDYASEQYDRFAEKRRMEAQQQADQNYIEDLKHSAQLLSRKRGRGNQKGES